MTILIIALGALVGCLVGLALGQAAAKRRIDRLQNIIVRLKRTAEDNKQAVLLAREILKQRGIQAETDGDLVAMEGSPAPTQLPTDTKSAVPRSLPFSDIERLRASEEVDLLLLLSIGIHNEADMVHALGREAFDRAETALLRDGIVSRWKQHVRLVDEAWEITPSKRGAPTEAQIRQSIVRPRVRSRTLRAVSGPIATAIQALVERAMTPDALERAVIAEHRRTRGSYALREIVERGYARERDGKLELTAKAHFDVLMNPSMCELYAVLPADTAVDNEDIKGLTGWHGNIAKRTSDQLVEHGYATRRADGIVKSLVLDRDDADRPVNPPFTATLNNRQRRNVGATLGTRAMGYDALVTALTSSGDDAGLTIFNMEKDGELEIRDGTVRLTPLGAVLRIHSVNPARVLMAHASGRVTVEELRNVIPEGAALTRALETLRSAGVMEERNGRLEIIDPAYDLATDGWPGPDEIERWLARASSSTVESYGRTDGYAAIIVRMLAKGPAFAHEIEAEARKRDVKGPAYAAERLAHLGDQGYVTLDASGRVALTLAGLRTLAMSEPQERVHNALGGGPLGTHEIVAALLGAEPSPSAINGVRNTIGSLLDLGFVAETEDGRIRMAGPAAESIAPIPASKRRVGREFPYPLQHHSRMDMARLLLAEGPQPRTRLAAVRQATPAMVERLRTEGLLRDAGGDLLEASPLMNMLYARSKAEVRALMAITSGMGGTVQLRSVFPDKGGYKKTIDRLEFDAVIALIEGRYEIIDPRYKVKPGVDGAPTIEQFHTGVLEERRLHSRQYGTYTGVRADMLETLEKASMPIEHIRSTIGTFRTAWSVDDAMQVLIEDGMIEQKGDELALTNKARAEVMTTAFMRQLLLALDGAPAKSNELAVRVNSVPQVVTKSMDTLMRRGYAAREDGVWRATLDMELAAAISDAAARLDPDERRPRNWRKTKPEGDMQS